MKKKFLTFILGLLAPVCLSACGGQTTQSSSSSEEAVPLEDDGVTGYTYDNTVANKNGSMSYEIFVRSFYDSNGDGTGDLNGVKEKLPYLNDLGIKTLWLMPIHPSPTYHGYDVTDYYDVNPEYGTLADFDSLVAEAEKYNIDIMIDMVLNHCSVKHEYFTTAYTDYMNRNEAEDSKANWFNFSETNASGSHVYNGSLGQIYYESWFDSGMPDFNLDCDAVRDEIEKIMKFWIVDHKVKAFRLDAVLYYYYGNTSKNKSFLTWLKETATKYNPNFYMVGECYSNNIVINDYYNSECDSFFRFEAAKGGDLGVINVAKGNANAYAFANSIASNEKTIKSRNPNGYSSYFLSNHDQDRIGDSFKKNQNSGKAAASLLGLLPGTSFMYYGEEIGLLGTRGDNDGNDVKRRLPMIWSKDNKTGQCSFPDKTRPDLNNTKQVENGATDLLNDPDSLLNHYKKVINLRNKYSFIKTGTFESLSSSLGLTKEHKGIMAYKITDGDDYIIVVTNFGKTNDQVTSPGTEIVDSINTIHKKPEISNGLLKIGAYSTVILK